MPEGGALRADARRNRARLLEVAEQTFAAEGLAVPIDTIARRAGVGVGTVYRHFPTKEALFRAIIVDRVRRLTDHARALATADDPGEAFFGHVRHLVEEGIVNKALIEALSDAGGADLSDVGRGLTEAQAELLHRAQGAGAVRRDVHVADLKALLPGYVTIVAQSDDAERLITVVLDGLRPRPA